MSIVVCAGALPGRLPLRKTLAQSLLNTADRENMQELRDVRAHSKCGTLVLVKRSDVMNRHVQFCSEFCDDWLVIGRLLERDWQSRLLAVAYSHCRVVNPPITVRQGA